MTEKRRADGAELAAGGNDTTVVPTPKLSHAERIEFAGTRAHYEALLADGNVSLPEMHKRGHLAAGLEALRIAHERVYANVPQDALVEIEILIKEIGERADRCQR